MKNFHAHAAGLKQGARNLSLHLEDLKTAPSKASRQEQEAQWRAEFACMTRAQKTDLAQEMALKEDGLRVQLERATAENMAVIKQVVGRLEWHDSWAERTREKEAALRKTTRPQAPARKRDDRVASRGDEADPVVQPPPQTPERLPAQADRTPFFFADCCSAKASGVGGRCWRGGRHKQGPIRYNNRSRLLLLLLLLPARLPPVDTRRC